MTRSELRSKINELRKEWIDLEKKAQVIIGSITKPTNGAIAGAFAIGGIATAWMTFGLSLLVSGLGAGWCAKEVIANQKARNQLRRINDRKEQIIAQLKSLKGQLPKAPPP